MEAAIGKKQTDFVAPPREKKERSGNTYGTRPRDEVPRPVAPAPATAPRPSYVASALARPEARPPVPRVVSEAVQRNKLRYAIEKAKTEGVAKSSGAPVRSPADNLREKQGNRSAPKPPAPPHHNPKHTPHQTPRPSEQREPDKNPSTQEAIRTTARYRHTMLQQVINGTRRDTDDL